MRSWLLRSRAVQELKPAVQGFKDSGRSQLIWFCQSDSQNLVTLCSQCSPAAATSVHADSKYSMELIRLLSQDETDLMDALESPAETQTRNWMLHVEVR